MVGLVGCTTLPNGGFRPLPKGSVPARIAVASFENRSGFEGQWQIGSGMAELLVSELVKTKQFVVLERQSLDSVVAELSRQGDRHFREEGRPDEGRLENARYLIRGVVTDFTQTGSGALWLMIRHWLIGSGGYTARVGLTMTIIDIENGRIVGSVQSSGKARAGNAFAQADYGGVQFGGRLFFQTPLGKATAAAMEQGLRRLSRSIPRQRWRPMIAEVDQGGIILNGGRSHGIRPGQCFQARGRDQTITDPQTGDVLDILPGPVVGVLTVTEVRPSVALAKVAKGAGFARGQRLEEIQPPE